MTDLNVLRQFLEFPIWTSKPIFDKFREIEGADFREESAGGKQRFLFINGKRENKVVLIAHADTYFDEFYDYQQQEHRVVYENGFFVGRTPDGYRIALGADDRAGCAILWALKDSGHSILVVDGEEKRLIGSNWLMDENPDIADKINQHQFMIEFDRKNSTDFKCYDVGTDEFRNFIIKNTNYSEPDKNQRTDICTLCADICGVNFSVGYYSEHYENERINYREWQNTLNMTRELLKMDLPSFPRH